MRCFLRLAIAQEEEEKANWQHSPFATRCVASRNSKNNNTTTIAKFTTTAADTDTCALSLYLTDTFNVCECSAKRPAANRLSLLSLLASRSLSLSLSLLLRLALSPCFLHAVDKAKRPISLLSLYLDISLCIRGICVLFAVVEGCRLLFILLQRVLQFCIEMCNPLNDFYMS